VGRELETPGKMGLLSDASAVGSIWRQRSFSESVGDCGWVDDFELGIALNK